MCVSEYALRASKHGCACEPDGVPVMPAGGFSGSGELAAPRYVIDEGGNLLYEYDSAYIENR